MTTQSKRRMLWGLLCLALLLGTLLRCYRLGAQSLWHDEGNSARLVERSLRLIVEGAAGDIHPPGYYLLLRGWWLLTGNTEFALRSFSALCGVLTIAVAAALGRQAGGWATATGAAWLVAIHPLAVYYSQEARMYALLGLVAALTLWAAARLIATLQEPSPKASTVRNRTLVLALCIALGLYTQYTFAFVLTALNLAFALTWLIKKRWQWSTLPAWITAHALGGLAFLPWLPNLSKLTRWQPPDLNSGTALVDMPHTLLSGITLPIEAGTYLLPIAGLLLAIALGNSLAHLNKQAWDKQFATWAALLTAVLPTLLIAALNVYRPSYLKFLMASVAPLAVTLTLPLSNGAKRHPSWRSAAVRLTTGALLLALLPAQVKALRNLYNNPAYARDDYRGIAAHVAAEAGPDDGILLNAPNQWEVFTYYYQGPLAVYPAPYHPTEEETEAWITEILNAQHPELFVLYWGDNESDPQRTIERALATRTYKASEIWVDHIRLARYGTAARPEVPDVQQHAMLGESIAFEGYALPTQSFTPGEIIPVTLFWKAQEAPETRLKVFAHLMDASGTLRAQSDAEPAGGFRPTDSWQAGETIIDRYGVTLPPELLAGTYTLRAGMYTFDGERLPVTQAGEPTGDTLLLGTLTVTAP